MRVLLINNQHYPKGGAHVVYFNTAELLKKNGHDVFFFSTKDDKTLPYEYSDYFPKSKDYRNLSIISKLKSIKSFIYNKEAYQKINEYIKVIKPDVAHVHLFMGGLTVSVLRALKENNIPIVHSVHDYRLICPSYLFLNGNLEICEKCKKHKYYNCIINKCSEANFFQSAILTIDSYFRFAFSNPKKYIDKYIAVSNFALNKHKEFQYDNENKFKHIFNFVSEIETILPNENKGDYMLFMGRLSREKGISTLLKSITELDVKLKIAGNGPLYDDLNNNSIDNVEFLGFQSGDDLIKLIKKCSFVIVPSEWYENNPMSIIESYAYGKPVIGANIGGIPEIIIENKTGFLFKSGDEISLKKVIEKADEISINDYNLLSQNARDFAINNFSSSTYYTKLIDLYNELVSNNKIKNI